MPSDSADADLPPGCPPLAWPDLGDDEARFTWYGAVIEAYFATYRGRMQPVAEPAIVALEDRIGCRLPEPLRSYHLRFGATGLGEKLCSVTAEGKFPIVIQPLRAAYKGVDERVKAADDRARIDQLIVFGDYLGNGNMFAFERGTGAVWYFDHDDGEPLTRFFDGVVEYLDALMIRSLGKVHDMEGDRKAAQDLLVQRHGEPLVRKWLY